MNNGIMRYNDKKIDVLRNNIREFNGDYRLICIDVDDVVFNIAPLVQEIIKNIDYRASNEYRANISKEASADFRDGIAMSFTILDAILEERKCTITNESGEEEKLDFSKPIIDYESLYSIKNLFPHALENITNMLKNRRPNDFIIFLSHRNPEREAEIKIQKLYELFPEIDAVVTLPYHKYPGEKAMNDKGAYILPPERFFGAEETLSLVENLDNCILIDNTKRNCINWRAKNGIAIRYLPEDFELSHTLFDHLSKLTDLNPNKILKILDLIKYAKKHPEWIEGLDNSPYSTLESEKVLVKK